MTPAEELDSLTDAALSEAFAVEVAGWKDDPHFPEAFWLSTDGQAHHKTTDYGHTFDLFATSADAVLPFLEERYWASRNGSKSDGKTVVRIFARDSYAAEIGNAHAPTFARAACIALIRAKRAEKGTV